MSRPLRVLTIGHSYVVGLNRAIAREVAKDSEFDVTVAAPAFFHGDLRPMGAEPEPPGSRLKLVPIKTRCDRFIHLFRYDWPALKRLIHNGAFDLIHAWEEPYIYAGYQIAAAVGPTKVPFCFRTAQSYVKRYPPPFCYFERQVRRRAQGWIAGASLVYAAMLERGYPKDRGRILNLAVDLTAFRPSTPDNRGAVLDELGLKGPVIGYVGRLTAAKGLDVLLQAMEALAHKDWSLLLLGSGEYKRKIDEWALEHNLTGRVRIRLVKHDEAPLFIAAMDLMVAPSQTMRNWREQFGRMIIEAFACGVPVIGSDSGEIPFVIGNAGRILPEADVGAWTKTIEELLDDRVSRVELAARGLRRAEQFSAAVIGAKYKEYYRWLAKQSVHERT